MRLRPRPADESGAPVSVRGRTFLTFRWPELERAEGTFAIAATVAGRYRVEGLYVPGQFSVLARSRDLRTGRPVLLKALRTDLFRALGADAAPAVVGELRRLRHILQTERRLLVRLRNAGCNDVPHPHDYVYDLNPALLGQAGEAVGALKLDLDEALSETEPYLVLPFLDGVSLEERLATDERHGMDEGRALALIRPIVAVLERLHEPWRLENGRTWHCVYQDLKPANILVQPDGRPMLLDFAGCQVVVDGTPVLEGSCTPGYAPPECEGGVRVLLPCADVYGIGSTLYHMLTGTDPRDLHRAAARGEPGGHLDLRALPAGTSPGVRGLLERCLAPRPSERDADARQVGRRIDALLAERIVAESP